MLPISLMIFIKDFVNPKADEKSLVTVGRLCTVVLMFLSCIVALYLETAKEAFNLIVLVGAGTGLLYILRWFWWRINAYAEITAMVMSFAVAVFLKFGWEKMGWTPLADYQQLLLGVGLTTCCWLLACFLFRTENPKQLLAFYKKVQPANLGWKHITNQALKAGDLNPEDIKKGKLPVQIIAMLIGCLLVYCLLFGIGSLIYGYLLRGMLILVIGAICTWALFKLAPASLEQ